MKKPLIFMGREGEADLHLSLGRIEFLVLLGILENTRQTLNLL